MEQARQNKLCGAGLELELAVWTPVLICVCVCVCVCVCLCVYTEINTDVCTYDLVYIWLFPSSIQQEGLEALTG